MKSRHMPRLLSALLCLVLALPCVAVTAADGQTDTDGDGISDAVEQPAAPAPNTISDWRNQSDGVSTGRGQFTTPAGASDWASQVNSPPMSVYGLSDRYRVQWTLASSPVGKNHMVGLGAQESAAGFDDIDFAFYISSGRVYSYESGVNAGLIGLAEANTQLVIEVDGSTIRYRIDGDVVRVVTTESGRDYYIDSSFYRGALTFDQISVAGLGVNPDVDGDGVPNLHDLDSDNDTIADAIEAGLTDRDGDFRADGSSGSVSAVSVPDSDRDGIPDYLDSESGNPANDGTAFDIGNTVFASLDSNGDGKLDGRDNHSGADSNSNGVDDYLEDADQDGISNIDDTDDDNDTVLDGNDALPFDPAEFADRDADGIGDNSDRDSDNDGLPDSIEEPLPLPKTPIDQWLNASAGVSLSGNEFTSPVGRSGWQSQINSAALSSFGFNDNYRVSWRVGSSTVGSNQMVGLGAQESGAGFGDIDYAFYNSAGQLFIYEVGVIAGRFESVSQGTVLAIEVEGSQLRYLVDDIVVREIVRQESESLYVDASFFRGAVKYQDFTVSGLSVSADLDADGVSNAYDLDSDNDTIADVIEAGLTDRNADLRVDLISAQASVTVPPDSDGDGLADYLDLESYNAANDGTAYDINRGDFAALDTNADGQLTAADRDGGIDANGNGVDDLPEDADQDGIPNDRDPDDDNDGVADVDDALPFDSTESLDRDFDGVGDNSDNDTDNDGIEDSAEVQDVAAAVAVTRWRTVADGVMVNGNGFTTPLGNNNWRSQVISEPFSSYGFSDNYRLSWTIAGSAGNGNHMVGLGLQESSPDWSDIDYAFYNSAGRIYGYESGQIIGLFETVTEDVDLAIEVKNGTIRYRINDRLVRSVRHMGETDFYIDSSLFKGAVSYSDFHLQALDTNDIDEDGVSNVLDLDSDNDTIADVIEAGLIDRNGDLIVDTDLAQGSVLVPPDSDADGLPDFLDIESHNAANDGSAFDIASTVFAALDSNGDGTLDGRDVSGGVDANGNGVEDILEDVDQDGVDNSRDPDDDNDGVPDLLDDLPFDSSASSDVDGDGVGDLQDNDTDNDGIADTVERPPVPAPIAITDWHNVSGNVTLNSNSFTSPAGSGNWQSQVNSQVLSVPDGSNGFRVSWTLGSSPTGGNQMVGLGVQETSDHFDDINYAFYNSSGRVYVYESGESIAQVGIASIGTAFAIEVVGGTVRYLIDDAVVLVTNTVAVGDFYIDSSFFRGALDFTGFYLTPLGESLDADADGVLNVDDLDSDSDTIPDITEAGLSDLNGDFTVDTLLLQGTVLAPPDSDGDGIPDYLDLESHNPLNDGSAYDMANGPFASLDSNGDGQLTVWDTNAGVDANNNGIDDRIEDADQDGLENRVDPDDDNDGVADLDDALPFDANEATDEDFDGVGDNSDIDSDNDGMADAVEQPAAATPVPVTHWLNTSGGVVVDGSAFITPAAASDWTAQINSLPLAEYGFNDRYRISWLIGSAPDGGNQMIGLGVHENGAEFSDIDFAFYNASGTLYVYESGINVALVGHAISGTRLALEVDGNTIRYLVDGIMVRAATAVSGTGYYIDSSFFKGAVRYLDFQLSHLDDSADRDADGVANALDADSDDDTIADVIEAGLRDVNGDAMVDFRRAQGSVTLPPDTDLDGVPDYLDIESRNPLNDGTDFDISRTVFAPLDVNADGQLNRLDGGQDGDADGRDDRLDDVDQDGIDNASDPDDDNDGVADVMDALSFNAAETSDLDGDGVGDNADHYPLDATESQDTDGDGVGDNRDAFAYNPDEWLDSDDDGVGDTEDAFPDDPAEFTDRDGDGVGDNGDTDSDNDGMADDIEEPVPPAGVPINDWLNQSADVVIESNGFTSPDVAVNWTAQVNSVPMSSYGLLDRYRVSWRVLSSPVGKNQMVGLSYDESGADWSDIEYAFYNSAGKLYAFAHGERIDYTGSVAVGTELGIEVDHDQIRFVVDGRVIHSESFSVTADLYIDASFFRGAVTYGDFTVTSLGDNPDIDNDGISNAHDLDSDNDSIPDVIEAGSVDADGNRVVDAIGDQSSVISPPDSDSDGIADYLDLESLNAANDGTAYDLHRGSYASFDSNGDGSINASDENGGEDRNHNGIDDLLEDTDRDGVSNRFDNDDDNDGVTDQSDAFPDDAAENTDSDGDGLGDNRDRFPYDASR